MIYHRFRKFVTERGLVAPGERVLAAVSGGSDSVAMLHLLARLAEERGGELYAACVHHGLRPEADDEARFVEKLARDLDLAFTLLRGDAAARARREKKSIQHAAREMRYELLEALMDELGASKLAVAHTLDDQAETVLMNILRGCGIDGLGGIPPARGRIIRPVIVFRRDELQAYLRKRSIVWCSDRSNLDSAYLRPRIRQRILPLLGEENRRIVRLLSGLAEEARETEGFLEDEAEAFLARSARPRGEAWAVARSDLLELPSALRARVIRRLFFRLNASLLGLYRPHVAGALRLAAGKSPSGAVRLGRGAVVRREYGDLVFERADEADRAPAGEVDVRGPGPHVHEALGIRLTIEAKADPFPLVLRGRRKGDRLAGRKTSLKELLIAKKVPRPARPFVPLLARGAEVLWAGGLFTAKTAALGVTMEPLGPPTPFLLWLRSRP